MAKVLDFTLHWETKRLLILKNNLDEMKSKLEKAKVLYVSCLSNDKQNSIGESPLRKPYIDACRETLQKIRACQDAIERANLEEMIELRDQVSKRHPKG